MNGNVFNSTKISFEMLMLKKLEYFVRKYSNFFQKKRLEFDCLMSASQKTILVVSLSCRLAMELDEANISLLLDMGFDREMAVDALLNFATISEATEHLVRQSQVENRQETNDEVL